MALNHYFDTIPKIEKPMFRATKTNIFRGVIYVYICCPINRWWIS